MTANAYHLTSIWTVDAPVQEVYDIVSDANALARWWPSAFLKVEVLDPGRSGGLGKVLEVVTKGWLPYTIHWWQEVIELDEPNGFTIKVWGGFTGRGVWTLRQDGSTTIAGFDWTIDADKPLLRYGSPIVKPLFTWNHRWIIAKGEDSLKLELRRRRATTSEQAHAVPLPPGPTWPHRVKIHLTQVKRAA